MKLVFTLDQKSLALVLGLVQNICGKKTPLEATACVLFTMGETQEVIVRVTDLETSLQFILPAEIFVAEAQSVLVNARRLFDFVKDLSSTIRFSYDGTTLSINYGSNEAWDPDFHLNLCTMDPTSFPAFPDKIENVINLETAFIQSSLDKVINLIPQNNINSSINGLLLDFDTEALNLVATDGHSLILIKNPSFNLSEPRAWTLPKKAVSELKRVLDAFVDLAKSTTMSYEEVFLGICKGQVVFSGANFNFFTRLVAEPFPNYKAALNYESFSKGSLALSTLSPILKRVGYLLSGKFLPAEFLFKNNHLKVSFDNPDSGKFSEIMALEPKVALDCSLKFYSPYVLSCCSVFDNVVVDFYIKSKTSPIFFKQDFPSFSMVYLIMPIVND